MNKKSCVHRSFHRLLRSLIAFTFYGFDLKCKTFNHVLPAPLSVFHWSLDFIPIKNYCTCLNDSFSFFINILIPIKIVTYLILYVT